MCGQALRLYARMDSFHRKNYNAKERKQNHYAIVIVKKAAGCTEVASWPWTNWQHVYFYSKVEISNVQ